MSSPAKQPLVFEEFFDLGKPDEVSPFITRETRHLGQNLDLKASFIAAVLLIASFTLSFHPDFLPLSRLLLLGVYFLAGIPSLIESLEDLTNFEINIDILMTLAAFSSVLIGSGMEGGLLLVLFALSGAMEEAVRAKAKSAISSLHQLAPTFATVVEEDGALKEQSVKEIPVGTSILVKAGQVVPLDGTVTEGASSVNLVHLTGENFPVTKKEGDEVAAGARNLEGALILKITKTSADSTLSRIIQLVTQAQEARPKLQRWFDSVSRAYAATIIALSFFFTLTLPFLLSIPILGTEGSLYRSLAFLIAASPCALIIAIPIAYLSAISACARKGILLKGGIALDQLASCKSIAFDKTGTLTTGELTCLGIEKLGTSPLTDQEALAAAYALERNAVHPIAKAILSYAKERSVQRLSATAFQSVPGYGLEGEVRIGEKNYPAAIGNLEFMKMKLSKEKMETLKEKSRAVQEQGKLTAFLLINHSLFLFTFTDTLRPEIKATVEELQKKWSLEPIMLTGDHEEVAKRVSEQTGIQQVMHDLKPEDKLRIISELSNQTSLAMIGDGINDAPALARATVGICMGKVGATAAMDASDIVLLHDNIELLEWLFAKAKKTQRIVKENLTLATLAILVASIPALGGYIPLWLAVIMHEGGTILVGLNALRLFR